ncbi:hypothetical protein EDD85DRAFT_798712 [Armillaria nabsnona]|nr:hypothetical protein EDD85DRAFT_798712 [Armillaria nabsnona]
MSKGPGRIEVHRMSLWKMFAPERRYQPPSSIVEVLEKERRNHGMSDVGALAISGPEYHVIRHVILQRLERHFMVSGWVSASAAPAAMILRMRCSSSPPASPIGACIQLKEAKLVFLCIQVLKDPYEDAIVSAWSSLGATSTKARVLRIMLKRWSSIVFAAFPPLVVKIVLFFTSVAPNDYGEDILQSTPLAA